MELKEKWNDIKLHFRRSFKSNLHVSVGSVDINGMPSVTPIGSLFLNHDSSGFYFEKFPSKLPALDKSNNNISILAVNSSKLFWIKSIFRGKFKNCPAIKLYGTLGVRRKAEATELARLKNRMKYTGWMKGQKYLWADMEIVREIHFKNFEIINLGYMTSHLWTE